MRFAHNCNCYNDNLLDLNSVALQNATLNGEKWEFGCMDQVALDLTNRKERWACFMETSTRQPSQYPRAVAWRSLLWLSSFCCGHEICSVLAVEKGALWDRQLTEVLSWWFPTHLFEALFGYSFWIMPHLFLFEVFKKIWKRFRSSENMSASWWKTLWFIDTRHIIWRES